MINAKRLEDIRTKVQGPVFPIPTPFNADYSVDYGSIKRYIDFLIEAGAATLMVTVGTSRFELLTNEEMKRVNEAVVKAADGRAVTVVANPITGPTSLSVEFARHAESIGADLFLAIYPERYYSDDAVHGFFEDIASASNIGIMIHEMHMRSGIASPTPYVNYSIELMNKILSIENVVGMKEESHDIGYAYKILRSFSADKIIIGGGGGMRNFLSAYHHGSTSYLVGIGNFVPKIEIEFYSAITGGNIERAKEIVFSQEEPFFDLAVKKGWHVALKAAMDISGLIPSTERPPLHRLGSKDMDEIRDVMTKCGWITS